MTDAPAFDAEAFREFEHGGWENLAAGYEKYWTEMTTDIAGPLLDGTKVGEGSRLLDVATGPGNIAGAAAARGAVVTGVDFSETMVEMARRDCPGAEFRQGDAEALPFDAAGFDAVVINFGMLHFPDPDKALAEAQRVLRPGGGIGITAWSRPGETGIGIAMGAVRDHGRIDVDLPQGTDMFRFADADECQRVLSALGFVDIASRKVPLTWRFRSPDDLIVGFMDAAPRSGGLLKAQTPEDLRAIRDAMRQAALAYEQDGAYHIPMPAVLTTATKS
ncbi:MAG: methyltransferase domain-containing protein [Alphaproteobacteria bacterium]|jgi:ubiquinone/menaquinone biosynthesis C-methylase UbiE|nr:methyltransferase domain-containing protein [Alphaproteobacteria bacterium]MDP6566421.1 methyltransferase domain-containing protein [Alphaproteobacteria bacterium]MDP6811621.1 methyltransferase domain-containing protein [Alphaproteobacteria bacterium]